MGKPSYKQMLTSGQNVNLNEDLIFYIFNDGLRHAYQYQVRDMEGDSQTLHFTPEAIKSMRYEALLPGTIIRCLLLKIIGGKLIADKNSHVQSVAPYQLSEEEKKIFGDFKADPPVKIKIQDVLSLKTNQMITEEISVKLKKKIVESSAYGTNKFARLKIMDSSGRMMLQIYQQNPENSSLVSSFEEGAWYKIRNCLLDVNGAEPLLKINRELTVIEKLSPSEIKKQTPIPTALEKGDFEFLGKIEAFDKIAFIKMCSFCPNKAAMHCKVHPHDDTLDKQTWTLTIIAYGFDNEKCEIKATAEKLLPYKQNDSIIYNNESLLKAFEPLLKKKVRIFFNKTWNLMNNELKDCLFEALEFVEEVKGKKNVEEVKGKKKKLSNEENDDPEAKKVKK